jgi:hypothetical protein
MSGFAKCWAPDYRRRHYGHGLLAHRRGRRRQLGVIADVVQLPHSMIVEHDLLTDRAVRIIEVRGQRHESHGGLQPDDLLAAINDRIVSTVDDAHRILAQIPESVSLTATIIRDERCLLIEV